MSGDQAALMAGLDFTLDDLLANQMGSLSERQRPQVWRKSRRLFFQIMLQIALALWLIAKFVRPGLNGQLFEAHLFGWMGILYLITLIAWIIWLIARIWTDLRMGKVSAVEGKAYLLTLKFGKAGRAYKLQINDLTVSISFNAFHAFRNSAHYRVYYAPHSKVILSAEPLAEKENIE